MKNSLKKFMTWTMLLSFGLTTPVSSSLALASSGDLIAYGTDYMDIRGSQPSVVSLDNSKGITSRPIPVTLTLRDTDVKQVLRMIADKAGLNIIFKGNVQGSVTMDLVDVPLNSAFNMVLESNDLTYTIQDNTLIISDSKKATNIGKQELAVIPVKYINAAQAAQFLNNNVYNMKKPGSAGASIASANPATNEIFIFGGDNDVAIARRVISQFDKKPVVTTFKVNHSTPEQMADMVCKLLLPSTGDLSKSGNDGSSTGGAAGVVTGGASSDSSSSSSSDYSSSSSSSGGDGTGTISLGEGAIACSGATVNSSSESSSAGTKEGEAKTEVSSLMLNGITVAYYTQLGTVNVVGGSPYQIEMIREFIAANDRRQPQAYIEFSIIELTEKGSKEFNNSWDFTSRHFHLDFNTDGDGKTKTYQENNGVVTIPSYTFGGSRPRFTTSNTATLKYTLSLLMQSGKARTISNPRILVTNGQESTIDLTEDYVKTVTSQIITGTMSDIPSVERTYEIGDDMGIKISVTPFISPDGFVYLNVKPDYTTEKEKVYQPSVSGSGQDLAATLLRKNNLELKNIRIKDGDTLVIGGMMKESETKNVSKIPFLGDIPGLGSLFRSSSTQKEKIELVILITPKITTDDDYPSSTVEGGNTL